MQKEKKERSWRYFSELFPNSWKNNIRSSEYDDSLS